MHKNPSKEIFDLTDHLFLLKFWGMFFVGTVFVRILFVLSIISSHLITELPIMLPAYLPFSQLHVAGFQI